MMIVSAAYYQRMAVLRNKFLSGLAGIESIILIILVILLRNRAASRKPWAVTTSFWSAKAHPSRQVRTATRCVEVGGLYPIVDIAE